MPKKLTGYGDKCAGGQPPFNDGRYAHKVGVPGTPTYLCSFCARVFKMADGKMPQHVYELKDPNVDVLDRSTNSQANLAARAFNRTRKG